MKKTYQLYTVFLLVLSALFASVLLSSIWVFHHIASYRQLAELTDIARQGTFILQQMRIEAEQIANGSENLSRSLQENITLYTTILNTLAKGGETEINKVTYAPKEGIPAPLYPLLNKLQQSWRSFRPYTDTIASQPLYLIEREEAQSDISLDIDIETLLEAQGSEREIRNPSILHALQYIRQNTFILLAINNEIAQQLQLYAKQKQSRATFSLIFFVILNLSLIVFSAFFVRYRLVEPMRALLRKARAVRKGELNGSIPPIQESNELNEIAHALLHMENNILSTSRLIQQMGKPGNHTPQPEAAIQLPTLAEAVQTVQARFVQIQEEEKNRAWAAQGLAIFVDILREYANKDLPTLGYALISRLTNYVGAVQAAIYVIEEEDKRRGGQKEMYAEMIACYAYGRKKFIKSRVYPREGILGQALVDGETIYIDDIPEGYTEIKSGLGGSEPSAILIVPLKLNEILVGVVELASFHPFEPYQIEFIERLATNIASTISNVKANERTLILLKRQEEVVNALRQQEEQLTQNMEELRATQEEMERNQAALTAQSFAIGSTLISIEYDLYGNIISANPLACELLGYSLGELKKKNHRQLIDTETAYSVDYELIWQDLREGNPHKGEFKHIANGGKEVWIQSSFVPIPDPKGKTTRIIFLGFDITEEKRRILDYEAQLQAIYKTNLVISFDLSAHIKELNEAAVQAFGYLKSEIIGKHLSWLKNQTIVEDEATKILWRKLRGGLSEYGSYRFYNAEGKELWLEGSFNPIVDLSGTLVKVVFFGIDITNRKEAERQIQEAQRLAHIQRENLLALINNTDERIFSINKQYFVTIVNDNAKRMFRQIGRDVQEGTNLLDTFPSDRYEQLKAPYDQALKGETIRMEESYIGADGKEIRLLVSYTPIRDDEDMITGVTVFAKDISELKRQEEELLRAKRQVEEKEQEIEAILNRLDVFIFSLDLRLNITFFNKAIAEEVLQRRGLHIRTGESAIKKIHEPEESQYWQQLYEKALQGETIITQRNIEQNGKKQKQHIRIEPLRNKFGKVYRCLVMIQQEEVSV